MHPISGLVSRAEDRGSLAQSEIYHFLSPNCRTSACREPYEDLEVAWVPPLVYQPEVASGPSDLAHE